MHSLPQPLDFLQLIILCLHLLYSYIQVFLSLELLLCPFIYIFLFHINSFLLYMDKYFHQVFLNQYTLYLYILELYQTHHLYNLHYIHLLMCIKVHIVKIDHIVFLYYLIMQSMPSKQPQKPNNHHKIFDLLLVKLHLDFANQLP
jgi:hypothetical protein